MFKIKVDLTTEYSALKQALADANENYEAKKNQHCFLKKIQTCWVESEKLQWDLSSYINAEREANMVTPKVKILSQEHHEYYTTQQAHYQAIAYA